MTTQHNDFICLPKRHETVSSRKCLCVCASGEGVCGGRSGQLGGVMTMTSQEEAVGEEAENH